MEGLQDLDQSVEILIRLLCAVPGWNEKNVQVFEVLSNGHGRITRHGYVQGMSPIRQSIIEEGLFESSFQK